jgi:hypothetical protein
LDSEERFVKYMITHPPTDANFGHAKTAAGARAAASPRALILCRSQRRRFR